METIDRCSRDYQRAIEEYPLLSPKEEKQLFSTVLKYKGGKIKKQARDKLFNCNLRLIVHEVASYNYKKTEFHDLVTAGAEGLAIAINRFNPRKYKTKLSTYATPWIRLKITRYLNENFHGVHVPSHVIYKSHEYKRIMDKQKENDDANLTDVELMEKLNVSERGLRNVRMSQSPTVSMDVNFGDDENPRCIKDVLSNDVLSSDKILLEKDRKEIIMAAMNELTPLEQDVLTSRYLENDKKNLKTLGKKYRITGERVRQIEYKALKRMRRKLKSTFNFKRWTQYEH